MWAFGAVLFEMLTGERAFAGGDVSETLAQVIMKEVDWTALPADTPASLRQLLQRCLERDPRQRLRDIGEARIGIARSGIMPASVVTKRADVPRLQLWQQPLAVALLVLLAAVGTGLTVWGVTGSPSSVGRLERFAIPPPASATIGVPSRDGHPRCEFLVPDQTARTSTYAVRLTQAKVASDIFRLFFEFPLDKF